MARKRPLALGSLGVLWRAGKRPLCFLVGKEQSTGKQASSQHPFGLGRIQILVRSGSVSG